MRAAVRRFLLPLAVMLAVVCAGVRQSSGGTQKQLRNGVIAYAHHGAHSDRLQIYTTSATGGRRRQLTTSRRFSSFAPSYSPDGKQIVFVRRRQSARFLRSDKERDLWTMHADGTHERRLTWTNAINEGDPAWSPDGKRIAFDAGSRGRSLGIWVMGVDGHGRRRLAPAGAGGPTWSPNGSEVAFDGIDEASQAGAIFVVSANGGVASELISDPGFSDSEPAWSPDGRRILFTSDRAGSNPAGNQQFDLWVMNVDGSGVARVTSSAGQDSAWSPDGHRIVYRVRERNDTVGDRSEQLYVIRADGTGSPRMITRWCSKCENSGASWQPLRG